MFSPFHLMAKPSGSRCNLDCAYCYYLEKEKLYGRKRMEMSDAMLERYVREYITLQPADEVLFTWHGGEPLLRDRAFYERALRLQQQYAGGKLIINSLQTNGTLLTDDWCKFFVDNAFLIGISIDGTEEMHNRYRRTRSRRGTWAQVMRGIELLQKHAVEWNAMAVVNHENVGEPEAFYGFFQSIDCQHLQFTPIVERDYAHPDGRHLAAPHEGHATAPMTEMSITPEEWGAFLTRVFDRWLATDIGVRFVQIFEATLAAWMGVPGGLCTMAPTCGHALAMEHNGDVYACDHYVFPEYRLGNLAEQPLAALRYHPAQLAFGANKERLLTSQCRQCKWRFACNGDCPRTRFSYNALGEAGHPYLCAGWMRYFTHVAPAMERLVALLRAGKEANAYYEMPTTSPSPARS